VGSPTYPTSPGRFFVWALVDYPHPFGPYGSYALGLSGFSDVITDWPGGGRMAIHGTADPTDRGQAVSHGCIRVFNPQLEHLRNVPLGTPVVIRP
jgi:lipoprotein-anchoring transpeptidase ErfK/SrfK